ncbi:MAG: tRNA (guanosine(37)-N1)-methyltransferase TrmD [Hyphomonadaceae bacterium]|nr:tRNA (guanosine(37)-N1)-methyltransferase TrmD [Clostridia bacterium]
MRFDVLTLFPEMLEAVLGNSIIGRARESGLVTLNFHNIRDYTADKHRRVDDYPYGGGSGMVMQAAPIYNAFMHLTEGLADKPIVVYLSPQGKPFTQTIAKEMLANKHYILLCGHYEGVDERILEKIVDIEISLGDFVLTGGEIPAMAVIDAVCRMVPGVLCDEAAFTEESHYNGLLEYPHYTRPADFMGQLVPEILLNGHHANIEKWRHEQAMLRTQQKRPDMYEKVIQNESGKKTSRKV